MLSIGSPGLQVAVETEQDTLGVPVKVQQLRDHSSQRVELIDLQEGKQESDPDGSVNPNKRILKRSDQEASALLPAQLILIL